jgi:Secretion system C-terminal sorting domain
MRYCKKILVISLFAALLPALLKAEGSYELNKYEAADAYRVFLSCGIGQPGGSGGNWYRITTLDSIEAKTYFFVYANAGDSICLASSALATGSGAIILYRPNGTVDANYTIRGPGNAGYIAPGSGSRNREKQGPFGLNNGGLGGYTPIVRVADVTGIWIVEFVAPNPNSTNSAYNVATVPPLTSADFGQTTNNTIISAFDVSIVKNGALVKGRVYSDFLSLSGGGLNRTTGNVSIGFTITYFYQFFDLYALTREGMRYDILIKGLAPYGYFISADNVGVTLPDGQTPAYESVKYQPTGPSNRRVFKPGDPETPFLSKHKLFFNAPDAVMPVTATLRNATTWLNPVFDATAYTYNLNYNIQGTPNPLAGFFYFNFANLGIRYKIVLDTNGDFIYGNNDDLTITGTTVSGMNNINWDGLDAAGNTIPQDRCVNARISFIAGEMHIPVADAEQFRDGIVIKRVNGFSAVPDYTMYWNDEPLNEFDTVYLAGPAGYPEKTPATGVNGNLTKRRWEKREATNTTAFANTGSPSHTNNYGDLRYMDQWAYDTIPSTTYQGLICSFPLDVQFTGIRAVRENNTALISWSVNNVTAGGQFYIERSNGTNNFIAIGNLPADPAVQQYRFTASNPGNENSFYRIRWQKQGRTIYSPIATVKTVWAAGNIHIYPNPAREQVFIQVKDTRLSSVKLITQTGQLVKTLPMNGLQQLVLHTSDLPHGIYLLEFVLADGKKETRKLSIQ